MVLKHTGYATNVISLFYNPKASEISIFGTFWRNFQFWPICFTENWPFWGSTIFMTSLWRHMLDVCTYFGMHGKRRSIAILWYQLDIFEGVQFSSHRGVLPPLPLVNRFMHTGFLRRGLNKSLTKPLLCEHTVYFTFTTPS